MAAPTDAANVEAADSASPFGQNGVPPLPAGCSPEQKDAHWFKHVYQGDKMPQLTLRAVVMGGVLGMLMAASNLYTTLTIGWSFGVAVTACVMSFVVWNVVRAITFGGVTKMSILENNCMASTASAAGYSTGATIATMFGALLVLKEVPAGQTAEQVKNWDVSPIWAVVLFTLGTGLMGVFLAIPLKRQMINQEELRFPTGLATAATLRSLYSESKDAVQAAYSLVIGIVLSGIVGILNTGAGTLPMLDRLMAWLKGVVRVDLHLPELLPTAVHGTPEATGLGLFHGLLRPAFGFEPSALLIGAGILTRMRASISMLAGSALLYWGIGPWLATKDFAVKGSGWVQNAAGEWVYDKATFIEGTVRNIEVNAGGTALRLSVWSVWGGTALMVAASLTAIAMQWRTVVRAFSGLGGMMGAKGGAGGVDTDTQARMAAIEVPTKWMVMGMIPVGLMMLFVQMVAFSIAWWTGLIAIALTFFLALVAARATGETDTTPVGAMGKVMQLLFAVLQPGQQVPNLAAAGISANSASSGSDLLTDLKSGYMIGANPRRQFLAQFFGVFFGTLAIVPVWFLMVPTKMHLEKYSMPATQQWAAVARLLTQGVDKLPESARWAILFGALVGVLLPVVEKLSPKGLRPYLPSAMGLGLSWVIPFSSALGFALGAIVGWAWELAHRKSADKFSTVFASGLIAGESLVKATIAMAATAIYLLEQMSKSGGAPPTP